MNYDQVTGVRRVLFRSASTDRQMNNMETAVFLINIPSDRFLYSVGIIIFRFGIQQSKYATVDN